MKLMVSYNTLSWTWLLLGMNFDVTPRDIIRFTRYLALLTAPTAQDTRCFMKA